MRSMSQPTKLAQHSSTQLNTAQHSRSRAQAVLFCPVPSLWVYLTQAIFLNCTHISVIPTGYCLSDASFYHTLSISSLSLCLYQADKTPLHTSEGLESTRPGSTNYLVVIVKHINHTLALTIRDRLHPPSLPLPSTFHPFSSSLHILVLLIVLVNLD
jgi:hypothetical protein